MYCCNGTNICRNWTEKLRTLNEAIRCEVPVRTCFIFSHLALPAHPGRISCSPGAVANLGSQHALKTQVIQHKPALQLVWSWVCVPLLITGTHPHFVPHFCLWDLTLPALLGAHPACIFLEVCGVLSWSLRWSFLLLSQLTYQDLKSDLRTVGLSLPKQTMSGIPLPNAAQPLWEQSCLSSLWRHHCLLGSWSITERHWSTVVKNPGPGV